MGGESVKRALMTLLLMVALVTAACSGAEPLSEETFRYGSEAMVRNEVKAMVSTYITVLATYPLELTSIEDLQSRADQLFEQVIEPARNELNAGAIGDLTREGRQTLILWLDEVEDLIEASLVFAREMDIHDREAVERVDAFFEEIKQLTGVQ